MIRALLACLRPERPPALYLPRPSRPPGWYANNGGWPIGRADYDLTDEEALALFTTGDAEEATDER